MLSFSIQAQHFNKRYALKNQIDNAFNIDQIDTSGYWLTVASENANRDFTIVILKIDNQGDTLWSNTYEQAGKDLFIGWANSTAVTPDSGLIMGGAIQDSIAFGHLVKFNKNGDTLWTQTYGDSSALQGFNQAIPTKDGGYIVVGNSDKNDPIELDGWVIKTDSVGNIEWEKFIGQLNVFETTASVVETSDGGYLLSGERSHTAGSPPIRNVDPMVIKIDSVGRVKWTHINDTPADDTGADAIETADSNYVYGSALSTKQDSSRASLVKLDKNNGNIIWSKSYGFPSNSSFFNSIKELSDSSIVGVGNIGVGVAFYGLMVHADQNGDSLFLRTYQSDSLGLSNGSSFWDVLPTNDGGFIACGRTSTVPPDTIGKFSWVVKVDSNGCGLGNCTLISVPELLYHTAPSIVLYPNPTNGQIQLQSKERLNSIEVYNLQGQLVQNIPPTVQSWELPPQKGIYWIKVQTLKGQIWGEKVVRQ